MDFANKNRIHQIFSNIIDFCQSYVVPLLSNFISVPRDGEIVNS